VRAALAAVVRRLRALGDHEIDRELKSELDLLTDAVSTR
jgi:hypothetical protein